MIRRVTSITLLAFVMSFAWSANAQYKTRPIISSINPTSGPPGTRVTINGKNFTPEYKVFYNGAELAVIQGNPTQLLVQLPLNAVQGRFTLRGPHQVDSRQVFWVVQAKVAPIVSSISPQNGPPGSVVTISGKNFSAKSHENTVSISGTPLQVRAASGNRITAVIPTNGRTGYITVQVYNAGQATSQQAFTVLAPLRIDSISPQAGPPGTKVTLTGSGFSAKTKHNTVTLGGKKLRITKATSSKLTIEIPKKGAKTARFQVDVKGVGSYEHPTLFPVVYPPVITSVTPLSGEINSEAIIQGKNFGTNSSAIKVSLTGRKCTVLAANPNEIRVRIPQGAVTGPFIVDVPKMGTARAAKQFEVWAPLAVTRMEPSWGLPGTEIRLWGTGFRSTPKDHALLIGSSRIVVDKVENGVLIFKIPEEAPDGRVSLTLEVKERGATQLAMPLTIFHGPVIESFSPKRGFPGTLVSVKGKYFAKQVNHLRVLLNGQVVPVSAVTPETITLVIPPGATSGLLEVQTKRRGGSKSKNSFELYTPVQLTSFLPSMGYTGQTVTIFGSGFEAKAKKNKVYLDGKKVKVIEASTGRLKVTVPKKSNSGKFRIEIPNRGSSESTQMFNVIEKLSVGKFDPQKGVPNTYVKITGKGFSNAGLRGYIGTVPIGVRVDSPTQVTIAIPPNGVDGNFVFTAPGAGRSQSKGTFDVLAPLRITGFQPPKGPEGTKASIYGTGFDLRPKKTRVLFGKQELKVEPGSSENMLIVTIPKGAMDAPFQVKVEERGQIESENVFTVWKAATATSAPVVAAQPQPAAKPATQPAAKPQPAAAQPAAKPQPAEGVDDLLGIDASKSAKIASLDTTSGVVGDIVTVNGSGFGEDQEAVKAWIGQVPATVIGVVPDMVMIEVPAGVKRGKIRLKIAGQPQITSKQMFTVSE